MAATVGKALGARAAGQRASVPTALLVSVAVGAAASVLTYRLLRAETTDAD